MIAVRRLSYTERHHTVLFYYFFISSALSLPLSLYHWKSLNGLEWLELISVGLLSVFGQWCFMRAFHHAKPSQLGPFCYMAVVYSGLIEWTLWGKVPDIFAWIGIALVCAGGIWTIRYSNPMLPKA
jgi:drug/metabolite transporter (DMT)-like permease